MRLMTALASILMLTSCIFDAQGDRFYRTLWTLSETPHGTDVTGIIPDGLTIEFLCGGSVKASARGFAGSYGTYTTSGFNASFKNLNLSGYHNGSIITLTIEEAHRNEDILSVRWHYSGSEESYKIDLNRRGSY